MKLIIGTKNRDECVEMLCKAFGYEVEAAADWNRRWLSYTEASEAGYGNVYHVGPELDLIRHDDNYNCLVAEVWAMVGKTFRCPIFTLDGTGRCLRMWDQLPHYIKSDHIDSFGKGVVMGISCKVGEEDDFFSFLEHFFQDLSALMRGYFLPATFKKMVGYDYPLHVWMYHANRSY